MVAALVVAAIVALGLCTALQPDSALAADDDGSATVSADIVLVAPGDGSGSGGGSGLGGRPGATRFPLTGDSLALLPMLAVALGAGAVALYARRQALAAGAGAAAGRSSGAHVRPARGGKALPGDARASARGRSSVHVRASHVKQPAVDWGRVSAIAIVVLVLAAGVSAFTALNARAADNDTIRIEMQRAADGSWSGETTYYLNNDATYFRDVAKLTEAAKNGFNLEDGSISITIAPASDSSAGIASSDAVKGAQTSGAPTWRIAGSAVSDEHSMALKVTATAKSLNAGDNEVGTATFDMVAPPYEDMKVHLSKSPVVGQPLSADVSDAPAEAKNDFSYTWFSSDDGQNWTPIPGATSATYTPTADMAGKQISVKVDCANPAWFTVTPANHAAKAPVSPAAAEGQHTVVFDVLGHGDAPAAQIVEDGDYAVQPDDPKAAGFTFGGWFADEECTEPYSFSTTPVTADITLYALWLPDTTGTYTVVHMLQGLDDPDVYEEGAREVKTGEFTGTLADIQKSFPGFFVNVAKSPEASDEGGAHVLKVYYDRRAYTVTYHVDNDIFHKQEQVRYGETVEAPDPDPDVVGKVFEGWTTDGSTLYDFDKPITGDLDLFAKFSAKKLTVTFETWGQQPKPDDQTVEYGNKAAEPSEPALGSGPDGGPKFKGWFKDPELIVPFDFGTEVITDDTVIYASYSPRVLFVLGDKGASVVFPVKLGADMQIDAATDPQETSATSDGVTKKVSAPGYKIKGWHKSADLTDSTVTSLSDIQEDIDLYPEFEANTYLVKFDKNDGDATNTMADQTFTYDVEQALSTNAFALQGYTFAGWNTKADGSGTAYADGQSVKNLATGDPGDESITLYAQWEPATDTPYVVEHYWETEDGSGYVKHEDETLAGTTGSTATATAKTYVGFTHNPSAPAAVESGAIAADGSLVLKVYYDRDTYTVTYDANGQGTAPAPETGIRYNAKATEPAAPTASGYTFGGWYTEPGCITPWVFDTDTVTADITLYAKWEGKTFNIKFDANASDASGTTADVTGTKVGQSVTLTANGFTRTGFTFAGWNTEPDGSGSAFADSASVAASSVSPTGDDVTLYAQWNGLPVTYTVEHYTQDSLNSANYTLHSTDSGVAGVAGQPTAATAKTIVGYDSVGTDKAGNLVQETIAGDSSTVVKIYYNLHSWKVTFETWGQDTVSPNPQQVANGGTATDPGLTSGTGNPKFKGWYSDSALMTPFNFGTSITADTTVYAKYEPNVLVDFQGLAPNVSYPKVLNSSFAQNELAGLSVPGYDIEGYYSDGGFSTAQTFPITMDASKHVYAKLTPRGDTPYVTEYYWQSLSNDAAYVLQESVPGTGTTGTMANANIKAYPGFTHDGTYSGAVESGVIAADGSLVLKVYYTRNTDTPYTVRHWQQNVDGTYPDVNVDTPADTDNLTGKTGASTVATAKTYAGFTAQPITQQAIAGTGDTVIDVKYARDTYTVTFNNQGHGTTPAVQTVFHGGKATEPSPDPAETGYDFGGWYTASTCYDAEAYDFETEITENKTLYAKWTPKVYDVSFDVRSAMANLVPDQRVEYGQHASAPTDPAKPGFTLLGWYHEEDYKNVFDFATEVIKKAIIVYGKFTPNKYNIEFVKNADNATGTMANLENVKYDEEKQLTANAYTRPGYTFLGWNTLQNPDNTNPGKPYGDGAKVQGLSTVNGATVKLYAQWQANADTQYKVEHYRQKLNAAGNDVAGTAKDADYEHIVADDQTLTGTTDTQTNAEAITAGEYAYFDAEAITQANIDGDGSTVVKVYYNRKSYTVTYDVNGGDSGTAPGDQTKPYGATLTLSSAEPTKAGTPVYTVSYNVNGGTDLGELTDANTKAIVEGKGYKFTSWNTAADGSGTSYAKAGAYNDDDDVTLFAQWEEAQFENTPVTLPEPTRANYTFLGWYTAATDGTKVGNAGDTYMPTKDTTLVARWTQNPYTITFVPNGTASARQYTVSDFDDQGLTSYTQVVDQSVGYAIDPCKFKSPTTDPTAKFIGWNTEQDGTGRWVLPDEIIHANDQTMIVRASQTKEITLYAQWSHLAGLTASDLASDAAYDAYKDYLWDVWIPVKENGEDASYDMLNISAVGDESIRASYFATEVSKVLITRLIGAGHDGDNMLTFASYIIPSYEEYGPNKTTLSWGDSVIRKSMNSESGQRYSLLPDSLKVSGVVKEVEKQSGKFEKLDAYGKPVLETTKDKFWLPGVTEVTGLALPADNTLKDGDPYGTKKDMRFMLMANTAYALNADQHLGTVLSYRSMSSATTTRTQQCSNFYNNWAAPTEDAFNPLSSNWTEYKTWFNACFCL